jgi:hypothetical protein
MAQLFKNSKAVVGLSEVDVYVCPALTTAIVIGAQASNVAGSTISFTTEWVDSSDGNAKTHLGLDIQIPGSAAYEPIGGKLVLEAGDKIIAECGATNGVEYVVSVLELT